MSKHIFKLKPHTGEISGMFKKKFKPIEELKKTEVVAKAEPAKPEYTGPYDECSTCGPIKRGFIRNRMVWDGSRIICRACANELYGPSVLCLVSSTYIS